MRVVQLVAYHVRIPLRRTIRHASHARDASDNVVVACRLDNGVTGFGEGVPRAYVTGETIDTAFALLKQSNWRALDIRCSSYPAAVQCAEALQLAPVADDPRRCKANAARCAVELALLDAYGQTFAEPLSTTTRLLTPNLFCSRPWVQYSGAITSTKGLKAWTATMAMRLYGFAQIKVKVGLAGMDDGSRLAWVRRGAGPRIELRVDANEAWRPDEVEARVAELAPFGIASVEQPVPHAQVRALAAIRPRLTVPIMLDESLCSMVDAETALADKTCDLFNIRLSKCGGFIPSLRLAAFAQQHGLGYQLGCQVGETALLSAAGRHWATSVGNILAAEGSYDSRLVRARLSVRDISFGWGGWAPALTGGGLGITVDPAALARVTVRQEVLFG